MMALSLTTIPSQIRLAVVPHTRFDFSMHMEQNEYLARQLLALEARLSEMSRVNLMASQKKKDDLIKLGYENHTAASWVKRRYAYSDDELKQLKADIAALLHTIVVKNKLRVDTTYQGKNFWYCEDFSCNRIFIHLTHNRADLKRVLSQYNFKAVNEDVYMLPYSENNAMICTYLKKRLDQ